MRYGIFVLVCIFVVGFASAVAPDDCDPEMISFWKFEDDTDDIVGSNDGSVHTGSYNPGGVVDEAIDFDGSETVTVSNPSDISFVDDFTIEFWFERVAWPLDGVLLDKGYYKIDYIGGSDQISATVEGVSVVSGALVPGTPYHVALTWDGVDLVLRIDGGLADTSPLAPPITPTVNDLVFGTGFQGFIDEVAFYNRTLTPGEITTHYSLGMAGNDYCYTVGDGGSTIRSDFFIPGCFIDGEESLSAGTCSADGFRYCSESGTVLYETLNDPFGCSRGDPNPPYPVPAPCCPAEYVCNDTTGQWRCDLRLVDCSLIDNEPDCGNAECYWIVIEGNGTCVGRTSDYSCSIYTNDLDCTEDTWNLGGEGLGTEDCGRYFVDDPILGGDNAGYVISQDSCRCSWEDIGNGFECLLMSDTFPDIFGEIPDSFSCRKNFETGSCVDGFQQINWTANATNLNGSFQGDQVALDRILDLTGCRNGTHDRSCGGPSIKLPGFSLFAWVLTVGILGLFYSLRRKE